jgi:hypothetical protein
VYELFVRAGARAGLDVDALVNRSVHALKPPSDGTRDEFGVWLRRRPSAPLVALLRRRLTTFDAERILRRSERGEDAARGLPGGVFHPGRKAGERTHWVFPVAVGDPNRTIEILRAAGFDATAGTSWIVALEPPPGREELRPDVSALLMEHVVYVPVYPELPDRAFDRLLRTLRRLEPAPATPMRATSRALASPRR